MFVKKLSEQSVLLFYRLKKKIRNIRYRILQKRAYWELRRRAGLYAGLVSFLRQFEPNEDSHKHIFKKAIDFWTLYKHIRRYKPREILECGSGVSTFVLAYAVLENGHGRVTSVDELDWWINKVNESLPEHLKKCTELILSEKTEHKYFLFRGASYKDIPDRPYDWVYIDGPTTSLGDGNTPQKTFDADFLKILARSKGIVRGLIDNRKTTCWVLQKVTEKVKFDSVCNIGHILPCTVQDLKNDPDEFVFVRSPKFL